MKKLWELLKKSWLFKIAITAALFIIGGVILTIWPEKFFGYAIHYFGVAMMVIIFLVIVIVAAYEWLKGMIEKNEE